MSGSISIPSTRVSNLLVQQQILQLLNSQQQAMDQTELELSSGKAFNLPSQDPTAAMQAEGFQQLLQQETQIASNITTDQSYMSATDTALGTVSNLLSQVQSTAMGALGTTSTTADRQAAVEQVSGAIQQLLDTANQQFNGQYLFAGSESTVQPFTLDANGDVAYNGNSTQLSSYSDVGQLFSYNVTGDEAFGALSDPVGSSANLAPALTFNTPLADLNGGKGVAQGSIEVSDGVHSSVIDLSGAETIGDVARLIQTHPPAGDTLDVQVTATGLQIGLQGGAGNLSIQEVGDGTTAANLGILDPAGTGPGPIVGRGLQPNLTLTTPLGDLLGSQATATVASTAPDSNVVFQSPANGIQDNGITVEYVNDPSVKAGHETAQYVAGGGGTGGQLTVYIQAGQTTAADVVAAVKAAQQAGTVPLTAALDPMADASGAGIVDASATATTGGGSGTTLDTTSGLQITNGGQTYTVDLSGAQTVGDLISALNTSPAGVSASLNAAGTGIQVQSRVSGADFAIGENGGTTATQLGLRTFTAATPLEDLDYGAGVPASSTTATVAEATLPSSGVNNGLVFTAVQSGSQWNGYTVNFVDSGGAVGSESLDFDPVAKTLTFNIVPGSTTANTIVSLMQNTPGARDDFSVDLATNQDGSTNQGTGLVSLGSAPTTGGADSGTDFTIQRNDGSTLAISLQGCETVGDVIDRINNNAANLASPVPLVAQLAPSGNGIQLIDNSLGSGTLTVTDANQSTAANSLGLIPAGAASATAAAPGAAATASVDFPASNTQLDFQAKGQGTSLDGTQISFVDTGLGAGSETFSYDPTAKTMVFGIDPATTTASTVISLLEADPTANAAFSVTLDPSGDTTGNGLVAPATASVGGGQAEVLTGSDANPLQAGGVFTALVRLQTALQQDDTAGIESASNLLTSATTQVSAARAELGVRSQGLAAMQTRETNNALTLQTNLSNVEDVDFAQATSDFSAEQTDYEASLKTTAAIFQMSLFNYL